jgi:hypothetical protein
MVWVNQSVFVNLFLLQHLSSVHCILTRDRVSGLTFVQDNSSNGTFVNNVQLGKNNRTMLKSMDEIFLLPTKYVRYMYKEKEAEEESCPGGPAADYHIQKTLVILFINCVYFFKKFLCLKGNGEFCFGQAGCA